MAETKNIQVEFNAQQVDKVLGDAERLQQIIWHLVTNAIKFTPAGGRVEIELTTVFNHSQNYAQIRITDTGIGISPKLLPNIFDRFQTVDATIPKSQSGLGLGLAIVHRLVLMQNVTINVQSLGVGAGITFIVQLPCVRSRSRQQLI